MDQPFLFGVASESGQVKTDGAVDDEQEDDAWE